MQTLRDNKEVLPVNFKRPRHYPSTIPTPKRKKLAFTRKEVTTRKSENQLLSCLMLMLPSHKLILHYKLTGEQQQSIAVESSTKLVRMTW